MCVCMCMYVGMYVLSEIRIVCAYMYVGIYACLNEIRIVCVCVCMSLCTYIYI